MGRLLCVCGGGEVGGCAWCMIVGKGDMRVVIKLMVVAHDLVLTRL